MKEVRIYKIESAAFKDVKKVLEEPEGMKEVEPGKQEWVKNEFARNGYTLRDAKTLGLENEEGSYLYISAEPDFFEKHEKRVLIENVAKLEGDRFNQIKDKIEQEQGGAAEGVGAIFG